MTKKDYARRAKILEPLAKRLPDQMGIQYDLACCLARLEEDEAALDALTKAVLAGWADVSHAEKDPDLDLFRGTNTYKILIGKMKENQEKPFEVQPTTAFSSKYTWDARGERVESPGLRYMLSTMLAVTSGRGNSVSEALASLRRSVAADGTQPRGTVYFMENGDVRATTRMPVFVSAILAVQGTPVEGKIAQGKLPQNKGDVLGAMVGSASFNWKQSGSTILPGAICEHLTSFGGIMTEGSSQTPLSEFIRYGAAGSSGTVHEPLAIPAKFPIAFMHAHYAHGCSLAEAYYQSVFGPYQLLIVGDPLCQPWAKPLQFKVDSPQPGARVAGMLTIEPTIEGGAAEEARLDHYEMYLDGRKGKLGAAARTVGIDTSQLGDGWHELSIVAVANDPVETRSRVVIPLEIRNGVGGVSLALASNPSGTFTYGEKLVLKAAAPLPAQLAVAGNGHLLGTVDGPEGNLEVDTRDLGLGPVRLQAGTLIEGKPVFSEPIEIQVEPNKPLPALSDVASAQLEPGVAFSVADGAVHVVDQTKPGKWLADLKPVVGQSLKLEGYLLAAAEDIHQFQLRGNGAGELRMDDQLLWKAEDSTAGAKNWVMVPVNLAPGYHHFELTGKVAAAPALEIRFGCQGCVTLSKSNVKHAKVN